MNRISLPTVRSVLLNPETDTLCGHLQPILERLQVAQGARIAAHDVYPENGWRTVTLDIFFYKGEIEAAFALPPFVEWSYADPHYGDGNSLSCSVCRCSLQARFDPQDPKRTLGVGK